MTIAILYICTGKYSIFWKDFFTSAEQFFVPGAEKEYFVFTDDEALLATSHPRIHVYRQEPLGWPYATLMRFSIFSRAEAELKRFDYIFFFNANMVFLRPVTGEEILPGTEHDGLTVVQHSGYYDQPPRRMPFEIYQRRSAAFLPRAQRLRYFQGSLNGGAASAYLQLIGTLKRNTQADLDKGIIARWHDESHLNKYMATRHPKILSPAYAFPEGHELPFEPVILMRDKSLFGGHLFMREAAPERKLTIWQRIVRRFRQYFPW